MSGSDDKNEENVSDDNQKPEADQTPEVKAEPDTPDEGVKEEGKTEPKQRRSRKPKTPQPDLGRMVRYVTASRTVRPAVITRVHEDDVVDLTVFNSLGAQPVESVAPGSDDERGTYHWPEFN